MKRTSLVSIVFLILTASSGHSAEPLEYRFDEVKSKVLLTRRGDASHEERAKAGVAAGPGDEVKTGFWGHAVLSVPARAARFEIGSSAHARLAGDEPGVILTIRSGRFKAWFEKLTSGEERVVAVPGALLSVRGTRYGVEADSGGRVALAVFEGRVEVASRLPGAAHLRRGRRSDVSAVGAGRPSRDADGVDGHARRIVGHAARPVRNVARRNGPGRNAGRRAPAGAMPKGSGAPMKGHGG